MSKHDVYYGELFLKAWDTAETDEESDEENEQVLDNIMEPHFQLLSCQTKLKYFKFQDYDNNE